jgi:hypothetical protein
LEHQDQVLVVDTLLVVEEVEHIMVLVQVLHILLLHSLHHLVEVVDLVTWDLVLVQDLVQLTLLVAVEVAVVLTIRDQEVKVEMVLPVL